MRLRNKCTKYSIAGFIMLLACPLGVSHAQSVAPSFNPLLAEQLQEIIDDARLTMDLKGISAAVIVPEQGLWEGTSGLSGATDTLKSHMRFGIASIKKTFVAATILQLAEEGMLSLDDSLHQTLPQIQYINLNISLRQLLSHTSGIYNYTNHPAFWNALWTRTDRAWMPAEVIRSFGSNPVFKPGTRFEYSNTNYLLLSMVIQAVTDKSVSTNYRDRFWNGLNLSDTFLAAEETNTGPLTHLWFDLDGNGQLEDIHDHINTSMHTLLWPFVYSTAGNLAIWAKALYGGNILTPSSLKQMLTFTPLNLNPNWTGYGLGAMRYNFDGDELWGHSGLIPGLRSIIVYSPSTRVSISVLVNQADFESIYKVVPLLYASIKEHLPTEISVEVASDMPATINLLSSAPNPFSQHTTIFFDIPKETFVTITVFDIQGKKHETLVNRIYPKGKHRVIWYAEGMPNGVYLYRMQADNFSDIKKMILLR